MDEESVMNEMLDFLKTFLRVAGWLIFLCFGRHEVLVCQEQ
jgi:hypothetical protein